MCAGHHPARPTPGLTSEGQLLRLPRPAPTALVGFQSGFSRLICGLLYSGCQLISYVINHPPLVAYLILFMGLSDSVLRIFAVPMRRKPPPSSKGKVNAHLHFS